MRVAIDNFNFSEFADVPSNVLRRTVAKSQNYAYYSQDIHD